MSDVHEIYKCRPFDEGGDKCPTIRPSSTMSNDAWEKIDIAMTSLPYSEQRMQQYACTSCDDDATTDHNEID